MTARIRLAQETDAEGMLAIYAPVVRETAISFELEPPAVAEFQGRIRTILDYAPWLICENDGTLIGYAYAAKFRVRAAYQWALEVTVYVHADFYRRNVGRALYTTLLACLQEQGYYTAIAAITLPNPASIALHESVGFRLMGVFPSVGYKGGRWHDVGWWGLPLTQPSRPSGPPRPLTELLNTPQWNKAVQKGERLLRL